MNKPLFKEQLQNKIPARWHMSLICMTTIASGILISKGILFFHLAEPMVRYGSAVLFSYGVFFILIYLWLRLHFPFQKRVSGDTGPDGFDLIDIGSGPKLSEPGWSGEGGQFSGGGASSSWEPAKFEMASPAKESSDFKGMSALGDFDDGIVIVLVVALLAVIFGSTGYIIYQAPEILFEAAFEVALVGGLIKRTKKMQSEGWTYSIFKRTWFPFAIVLCMALALGYFIKHSCPEASSFGQYRVLCWNQGKN